MACKLCDGGNTSCFGKGEYKQIYCHDCGGHEYKGLLISRKDWDRWVNSVTDELVGMRCTCYDCTKATTPPHTGQ